MSDGLGIMLKNMRQTTLHTNTITSSILDLPVLLAAVLGKLKK